MSDSLVRYSAADGIATLELCDPPANTYTHEMMRQLDEAVLTARFDPGVHVLVLRGNGEKFFCAGADIGMLSKADPRYKYYFCLHANETLGRLEHTPKIVIAALNGHAVGGGLEIALAADVRVARRDGGKIGLPEVNLGVLPGTGGTQRLTRALGRARAFELMALGTTLSVEQAYDIGLVQHVFESDRFWEEVLAYARQFVPPGRASLAAGSIKRAVVSGAECGFGEGLALERELQQRLFESGDAAEGLAAYIEKRKPEFRGR